MTWSNWQVAPFFTSVFFVLGVLALYQLTFNGILFWVKWQHLRISETTIRTWYGILYMVIFVVALQSFGDSANYPWQFMNFQIIGIIFCAYFLNIKLPYYLFFPVVLVFMTLNQSLGYSQSWAHAITLTLLFGALNLIRARVKQRTAILISYSATGIIFGGLLWLWMKLKFNFSWQILGQEWLYLTIFEGLLFIYVNMLTQNDETKLQLTKFASHDSLTGTENFAAYSGAIKQWFEFSQRKQRPLTMMMFDIDHFKIFNDTYGHLAGDRVLQQVAMVVQTVLNENDPEVKLYRTGGEEFNILFPSYTVAETQVIVTQIFLAINHQEINFGTHQLEISVSVGVSALTTEDATPLDFYNRVDQKLYHSKRNGRMQITY